MTDLKEPLLEMLHKGQPGVEFAAAYHHVSVVPNQVTQSLGA